MTRIIGLSGSLRRASFNTSLLKAAESVFPENGELVIETIAEIPLYNGDEEAANGVPRRVEDLKDAIVGAEGLLISTPEYNNSIPGVLKNAIDWLTRPPDDIARVFGDLPVAVMGASPGSFGTILAQGAWLPVFRTVRARFWTGGRLVVPAASRVFDDDGRLTDDDMRKRLTAFVAGFVTFAAEQGPLRARR